MLSARSNSPAWPFGAEPIPLPRAFFLPSAKIVARRLLGHWLLRRGPAGWSGGPIVETEAYLQNDPACHAFKGRSARNRAMWGPPGAAYVYLIYGFHCCVNAVCRPEGLAEAVLIRAIEAEFGLDWMRANRSVPADFSLTSGPGKLCAALRIDRSLDHADLCDARSPWCAAPSPILIAENPSARKFRHARGPVMASPRIGIRAAADWPLRFYLAGSEFLSRKAPKNGGAKPAITEVPES